jgi:ligand-binding sensor domain-containing protein
MVKILANWKQKALVVGWFIALVLAFMHITKPASLPPPPAGWTIWQEPGPTRAIAVTPDGVYAGGSRGLFLLKEDGTVVTVNIPESKGTVFINALLLDHNNSLWVAHNQGLSIRAGSEWKTLSEVDGLPYHQIASIIATKKGIVWLGTFRGAVSMPVDGPWNQSTISTLTTQDGLLHDTVRPIIEDKEGGLWFGNYAAPAGGLNRLSKGKWEHWTTKAGLPHPNVTSLMVANDGRVWAGCGLFDKGGAAVFKSVSGKWQLEYTIPSEELAGPKVRSLHQDRQGRVWLGSENNGLAVRFRDETICMLTPKDGLPDWEVMMITEMEDGTMWLGTQGGVVRIAPDSLATLFASKVAMKR